MSAAQIDRLIEQRNKLLTRRDGLYDTERVNRIDAQLRAAVAPGTRQDVDEMLGRVLPNRAAVTRWSTDEERETARAHGEAEAARLAAEKRNAFDAEMRRLCADYDIEAPTYDGMWK